MKIVVPVYKETHWALKPFSQLYNKYWGSYIDVMCYSKPDFRLPSNFNIVSVDDTDYPAEHWANGMLLYLKNISDDTVVILLEDYWLIRPVDLEGIVVLNRLISPEVLRVDLTSDRLYAKEVRNVGCIKHYDIVEAPDSQYQMSLQCGIWNRKLLIEVLEKLPPDKRSPWEVELTGTGIVNQEKYKVYGTRQNPVRYVNGMNNARGIETNLDGATKEDKAIMVKYIYEEQKRKKNNE